MIKKKSHILQMSPENYIRLRIRNLPIHQCLINSDWKELGVANIMISRQHKNGNITACLYFVDLYCLGIKNSFYRFNISQKEYNEMAEKMKCSISVIEIDYPLVHNIIYSAWTYADNLKFTQNLDFLYTTFYMLNHDEDENIPYIDIKCGLNGKPCYVRGSSDNNTTVKRVINHLTQKMGIGNFKFVSTPFAHIDDALDDDTEDI